jgi:hypothetical protein
MFHCIVYAAMYGKENNHDLYVIMWMEDIVAYYKMSLLLSGKTENDSPKLFVRLIANPAEIRTEFPSNKNLRALPSQRHILWASLFLCRNNSCIKSVGG